MSGEDEQRLLVFSSEDDTDWALWDVISPAGVAVGWIDIDLSGGD